VVPDFLPLSKAYGYYVSFNLLSKAQQEIGNRVEVFLPQTNERAGKRCGAGANFRIEMDGLYCHLLSVSRPLYFTFPARIVRELKSSDLDLIHSHARIGLPISALRVGKPHVVHLHGLPYFAVERHHLGLRRYDLEAYLYMRAFLRKVDFVISYCKGLSRRVSEVFKIPASKIATVYNGIDPSVHRSHGGKAQRLRDILGIRGSPMVLFVGRAEPIKGAKEFVESVALVKKKVPDLVVVAVGSGWERFLYNWQASLKVLVVPHVSYSEIGEFYRAADVHVAITKVYGYQKTALEAVACGTPVVAADNPDNRFVCRDTGFYVDPLKPSSIADGILRAILHPPTRSSLRSNAVRVRTTFTWKKSAERCQKVYEKLCDI